MEVLPENVIEHSLVSGVVTSAQSSSGSKSWSPSSTRSSIKKSITILNQKTTVPMSRRHFPVKAQSRFREELPQKIIFGTCKFVAAGTLHTMTTKTMLPFLEHVFSHKCPTTVSFSIPGVDTPVMPRSGILHIRKIAGASRGVEKEYGVKTSCRSKLKKNVRIALLHGSSILW